ncbi:MULTISPECIES: transposase [unclassified Streptomyces]|uniref:transposase n=1 Tax=unclassified Streptomyces TaxID=2593676 RepID=UPI00224F6EB0|nr:MULTISPECIES: transposase [unclassified Streptomyces]MCX4398738.1 transposase [Streptomyces sp. NBC_01767]WSP51030.1 transposase [Streptomyces sp. NBC_01243]
MESIEKPCRPRRSFTPEFEAEIVGLCRRRDRSVGQVAKDFERTETAVRDWVEQAEVDAGERNGLTSGERAVATRLRVALRGDRGRQTLQRLPGPDPIVLRSVFDTQRATLNRTSQGLHVDTPGPGSLTATLGVDPSLLTVSSANGDDLAIETVSVLLNPDPPLAAAEDFWALSCPCPACPVLS